MAEYIEREAAMGAFLQSFEKRKIEAIPAADVAPVVHGRWVLTRTSFTQAHYECSICGNIDQRKQKYCGGCGALMDKEATDGN